MVARVDSFTAQVADHVSDITRLMSEEGIRHPIIARGARSRMLETVAHGVDEKACMGK
jgi:hypothetical protein